MTNSLTPAEWIALLTERAPALRAAGVRRLQLAGCIADLAPDDPAPPAADPHASEEYFGDPLSDPATYASGRVPGYPREQ